MKYCQREQLAAFHRFEFWGMAG